MNLFKKICVLISIFFLFNTNVDALCYDSDLNDWASNLKLVFTDFDGSIINEETGKPLKYTLKYAFFFSLSNYRKDVTLRASNNLGQNLEWKYIPGYKVWGIGNYVDLETTYYKLDVVGNKDSACPNEVIKSFDYAVEPFNLYILMEKCDQYPDAPMCTKYKDTSKVSEEEFEIKMEEYIESVTPPKIPFLVRVGNFFVNYLIYIIIPFGIIAIFYTLKIYDIKRKEANK